MRQIRSVILLIFLTAASPYAAADSERVAKIDKKIQSYICTKTFSSCSDITAESCAALVAESISRCPSQQLESLEDNAIGNDVAEAELIELSRQYGLCVTDEFRRLAKSKAISEDCFHTAVLESIEAEKEQIRIELENKKKDASR
jgi:hypothetical protein